MDDDMLGVMESESSSNLGMAMSPDVGRLSDEENTAILAVALTCGFISFAVAAYTMRWFILMKRNFRHTLVLILIMADTSKALWYFVFPLVHFASPSVVATETNFCQGSGWLLHCAVESSDYAMLLLAVHTMMYIFSSTRKNGEGGLYPYRYWIFPAGFIFSATMASLAFIQGRHAYVTAGTLCMLPKRPFWYRLALSWIPRYVIFILILVMYASVYAYVHFKFRGFDKVGATLATNDYSTTRFQATRLSLQPPSMRRHSSDASTKQHPPLPAMQPMDSTNSTVTDAQSAEPWDSVNFITSRPLQIPANPRLAGIAEERQLGSLDISAVGNNFLATSMYTPGSEKDTQLPDDDRKSSGAPILRSIPGGTNFKTGLLSTLGGRGRSSGPGTEVQRTRAAIMRQLRLLFLYPLIYFIMWIFPFVNHILHYEDYYIRNPPFWLSILSTASLALQAAADSIVFLAMEKPWRRVEPGSQYMVVRFYDEIKRRWHKRQGIYYPKPSKFESDVVVKPPTPKGQKLEADDPSLGMLKPSKTKQWWEGQDAGLGRKNSFGPGGRAGTDGSSESVGRQSDS